MKKLLILLCLVGCTHVDHTEQYRKELLDHGFDPGSAEMGLFAMKCLQTTYGCDDKPTFKDTVSDCLTEYGEPAIKTWTSCIFRTEKCECKD